VLVLRNTKYIIQLIIIIIVARYCGKNHVLNLVYFPLFIHVQRLYNILKYFPQLFTSMGKVTSQQGWHDIYRRFTSMIYIGYLQRKCRIRYMYDISLSCKYRVASQLGDKLTGRHASVNWETMPPIFFAFCAGDYFS